MPIVKAGLDTETYEALMTDAARHLRPPDRHITALLRVALGLPLPLMPSAEGEFIGKEINRGESGSATRRAEP
jgi:hypothetical protein